MESTKICTKCKAEKPLSAFVVDNRFASGHAARCRECKRAYEREYKRGEFRKEYQKEYRKNNPEKAKAIYDKANAKRRTSCRVFFIICAVTGKPFTARRSRAKLSKEGHRIQKLDAQKAYYQKIRENGAYEKYLENSRIKYSKQVGNKTCVECSTVFTLQTGYSNITCSKACSDIRKKRIHKLSKDHKDRARKYGVRYTIINPVHVFNRDNWICRLCGITTPKQLRGTLHDNAPELDHIIPMSLGGHHIYDNVQCLCRKCNNKKSNKLMGQQPLFAAPQGVSTSLAI